MKGVLILAHGSRQKETEETLARILDMVRADFKDIPVETSFLQFSERNLEKGLRSLIERGVSEIKVIPYFLFEGIHIQEDIPGEIQAFLKEVDTVDIQFGKTLGSDPRLAAILSDRIREMI
jgi:sirohydrochlorin ferrochelatase